MQRPEGWAQAFVMHNLADVLHEMGELAAAKQMAQTSLQLFEALGDSYYLPDPQLVLAQIAGDEGEYAIARPFPSWRWRNTKPARMSSSRLRCGYFRRS